MRMRLVTATCLAGVGALVVTWALAPGVSHSPQPSRLAAGPHSHADASTRVDELPRRPVRSAVAPTKPRPTLAPSTASQAATPTAVRNVSTQRLAPATGSVGAT